METTLETEDRLPPVQARLSVIQPKILINLSSITFPFTFPCSQLSILPSCGYLFSHLCYKNNLPVFHFYSEEGGSTFAGKLYTNYTLQC